jgi:hypothetical protein
MKRSASGASARWSRLPPGRTNHKSPPVDPSGAEQEKERTHMKALVRMFLAIGLAVVAMPALAQQPESSIYGYFNSQHDSRWVVHAPICLGDSLQAQYLEGRVQPNRCYSTDANIYIWEEFPCGIDGSIVVVNYLDFVSCTRFEMWGCNTGEGRDEAIRTGLACLLNYLGLPAPDEGKLVQISDFIDDNIFAWD